tara:strand:+ start:6314 stop:6799 length:486 start_codon:yes stop_codon:yes gene_type:complete
LSYEATIKHLRGALQSLPAATVAAFGLRSGAFIDVDAGGVRDELELMAGQSRVFEIDSEGVTSEPVQLGGIAPTGYTDTIPIRVRYDAPGMHERGEKQREIRRDQKALIDAIHRSDWANVQKIVSLQAEPGDLSLFEVGDDAGQTFTGYILEVIVTASYDL